MAAGPPHPSSKHRGTEYSELDASAARLGDPLGVHRVDAADTSEQEVAAIYTAVLSLWNSECDRFWTRSNIFLIVNGALLTAFAAFSSDIFARGTLATVGLYTSIIWLLLNKKSAHYVSRWRPVLEALELRLPAAPLRAVPPDSMASKEDWTLPGAIALFLGHRTPRASTTHLMSWTIRGFVVVWVALLTGLLSSLADDRDASSDTSHAGATAPIQETCVRELRDHNPIKRPAITDY